MIHELFDPLLDEVAHNGVGLDWKTGLQELTAEYSLGVPDYEISSIGPDHAKIFTARASVNGELFDACTGRNKKEAEQGRRRDGLAGAVRAPARSRCLSYPKSKPFASALDRFVVGRRSPRSRSATPGPSAATCPGPMTSSPG